MFDVGNGESIRDEIDRLIRNIYTSRKSVQPLGFKVVLDCLKALFLY